LPIDWFDRVARAKIPDRARAVLLEMVAEADVHNRVCRHVVGYVEHADGSTRTRPPAEVQRAAAHLMRAGLIAPIRWRSRRISFQGYRLLEVR
jgi:hypothetical protein